MTGPDFDHFCRLIAQRSGLVLGPDKAYLVNSRLEPIAKAALEARVVDQVLPLSEMAGAIRRCVGGW